MFEKIIDSCRRKNPRQQFRDKNNLGRRPNPVIFSSLLLFFPRHTRDTWDELREKAEAELFSCSLVLPNLLLFHSIRPPSFFQQTPHHQEAEFPVKRLLSLHLSLFRSGKRAHESRQQQSSAHPIVVQGLLEHPHTFR